MSIPSPTKDSVQDTIEEGPARYAAFAMRLRTLITASSRYIAYTSDIGEAFRPLTNANVVRAAYAISWTYILGDVGYAGYRAHLERAIPSEVNSLNLQQKVELKKRQMETAQSKPGQAPPLQTSEVTHVGLIMARRAVFQSIASMALPAFTIHSIVRYSAPIFAKSSRPRVRATGPTIAGLAFVPALPYLFDEPVEHIIDTAFDYIEEKVGGTASPPKEASSSKKEKTEQASQAVGVISKAAILGIGVDKLHLPRLLTLLSRQARRCAAALPHGTQTASFVATQKFARRILHDKEMIEWEKKFSHREEGLTPLLELRWLAARWTVKEAAYKAMPNDRLNLSWHDAYLSKINNRPTLCHTPQLLHQWRAAGLGNAIPKLHVSITHDGDYVTAFVIAENSTDG